MEMSRRPPGERKGKRRELTCEFAPEGTGILPRRVPGAPPAGGSPALPASTRTKAKRRNEAAEKQKRKQTSDQPRCCCCRKLPLHEKWRWPAEREAEATTGLAHDQHADPEGPPPSAVRVRRCESGREGGGRRESTICADKRAHSCMSTHTRTRTKMHTHTHMNTHTWKRARGVQGEEKRKAEAHEQTQKVEKTPTPKALLKSSTKRKKHRGMEKHARTDLLVVIIGAPVQKAARVLRIHFDGG